MLEILLFSGVGFVDLKSIELDCLENPLNTDDKWSANESTSYNTEPTVWTLDYLGVIS